VAANYPNDFGTNRYPFSGANGRLQNFLLWDRKGNTDPSRGGLTLGQIFGDPRGKNPYPFACVIDHCMSRVELATKTEDNDGKPYLDPSRLEEVQRLGALLKEALGEQTTLHELMVTPNGKWPPDVESYSTQLEDLGISFFHMHRAETDIRNLEGLFENNFYPYVGDWTPAQLYTTPALDVPLETRQTIAEAKMAHALANHPDLLDKVDPRPRS